MALTTNMQVWILLVVMLATVLASSDKKDDKISAESSSLAKFVLTLSRPGAFKKTHPVFGDEIMQNVTSCPPGEDGLECRRAEARRRADDCPAGKTTLSTPSQDYNPDIPVIGSLVQHESDALDHVAIEAVYCMSSTLDHAATEACPDDSNEKGMSMVELIGNVPVFGWRESGKPLKKNHLGTPSQCPILSVTGRP
uniref:Uncharacterized protein n=1 Tax=Timema genevievae TaxID=629358 RepID=A0A7R9JWN1_TIMGE|nr:unnamed protein product [Timema genevievae]